MSLGNRTSLCFKCVFPMISRFQKVTITLTTVRNNLLLEGEFSNIVAGWSTHRTIVIIRPSYLWPMMFLRNLFRRQLKVFLDIFRLQTYLNTLGRSGFKYFYTNIILSGSIIFSITQFPILQCLVVRKVVNETCSIKATRTQGVVAFEISDLRTYLKFDRVGQWSVMLDFEIEIVRICS